MGFFGKLFGGGGPPKPPRWGAPFETLARFDGFMEWLQEDLENRGIPQLSKVLRSGGFVVKLPKKNVTLMLDVLAKACGGSDDPTVWARALDGYLTERIGGPRLGAEGPVVLRAPPSAPAASTAAPDFAAVKNQLKVQLYGPAGLASLGLDTTDLVTRTLAPGLVGLLVWDKGGSEQVVPRRFAQAWGEDEVELVNLGLANVRRTETTELQSIEGAPGLVSQLVVGPGHYVAAWTLGVTPPAGTTWPAGVLLALPSRHSALFHPITGPMAVAAYGWLAGVVRKLHAEYDDPVSDQVWWLRGDKLVALPARLVPGDDGEPRLELAPPPEFAALFGGVAAMASEVAAPSDAPAAAATAASTAAAGSV